MTVKQVHTKKGRSIATQFIVDMNFCDTTPFYACLHLFTFLCICINHAPMPPADLLLVFEGYRKAFFKMLRKEDMRRPLS